MSVDQAGLYVGAKAIDEVTEEKVLVTVAWRIFVHPRSENLQLVFYHIETTFSQIAS